MSTPEQTLTFDNIETVAWRLVERIAEAVGGETGLKVHVNMTQPDRVGVLWAVLDKQFPEHEHRERDRGVLVVQSYRTRREIPSVYVHIDNRLSTIHRYDLFVVDRAERLDDHQLAAVSRYGHGEVWWVADRIPVLDMFRVPLLSTVSLP